jgi:hypothetical protein
MNFRKIRLALAVVGAILSIALAGVKIHNELVAPGPAAVAPHASSEAAAPVPQKMTYTLTLSREVVVDDKK